MCVCVCVYLNSFKPTGAGVKNRREFDKVKWKQMVAKILVHVYIVTGAASYNPNLHNVNKSAEVIPMEDGHQEELPNSKPN